jgi:hypothetical protein
VAPSGSTSTSTTPATARPPVRSSVSSPDLLNDSGEVRFAGPPLKGTNHAEPRRHQGRDPCVASKQCQSDRISLGATGASGISALKLQESDASGSGYTDIVDFDGDSTYTDIEGSTLALPGAGNDDEVWVVHIDLRGRKRYLQCVVDSATNASVLGVTAVLGRAGESIATNAGHTSSTVGGAGVFVEI